MALSQYSELKTAVADYMARSDLTSQITDAVALCESRIHYGSKDVRLPSKPLRVRAMEERTELFVNQAVDGGTAGGTADALTATVSGATASKGTTISLTGRS